MTSSDRIGTITPSGSERDFAHAAHPLVRTTPSPHQELREEAAMPPQRTGRPRGTETAARTRDFLERIAAGETTPNALAASRMSEKRFARLVDDNAFFAVYQAVRRGDLPTTAAIVHLAPIAEPEAA